MRKLLLLIVVSVGLIAGVSSASAARHHKKRTGVHPSANVAVSANDPVLLGDTNVEATADSNGSSPEAWQYTASTSGSVTDIEAYAGRGTGKLTVGLYSDSNGRPQKLLAMGSISRTKASAWNDVTVGSATVTAGTKYWLAWQGTDSFRDRRSGNCTTIGGNRSIGGIGSSWSTRWTASGSCPASFYVDGTASTASALPPPPSPVAPSNTTAPSITGTPQVGDTLVVTNGTWSGDTPINFSVKWSDGATGSSDTLTSADAGQKITATVTATNDGGSATATSAAVGPVTVPAAPPPVLVPPSNSAAPAISGTPQVGDTLVVTNGTWSGDTPINFSVKWSDGATGSSDTLTSADAGQKITATVTATNDGGSATATSAAVGPVTVPAAPPPVLVPPSNSAAPAISGTPQVGDTLVVTNGTWSGDTPINFSVKWSDGATGSSDTLTSADAGQKITATVTATNDGGSATATSAAVGPVTTPPSPPSGSTYSLPANRAYDWDPGLNSVGGIPDANWTVYETIQPSGGDDTATIQAALSSCPKDGVVQLAAGVFHITGQGLFMEHSACVLRGAGPGPGNLPAGTPPAAGATGGTYLVKQPVSTTGYPVLSFGPQFGSSGTATNLTSDAVKGSDSVTVASTAGLAAGGLVTINELTDPSISHWNSEDPENNSGWFEQPNRPLGETLEIASISGNTVTFTTDFPIGYQVVQSAQLFPLNSPVKFSGVEDLYMYGGQGGDGGGGIHIWNCADCWVNHIEDTWTAGAAIHIDDSFQVEVDNSYFHDSQNGLYSGGANYGVGLNWYSSDCLIQNNVIINYNKDVVMRSAGGGNVWGYNYVDNGADLGGQWTEDLLDGNHMTTPHYELFEGNEAPNADTGDRWGNSVYITYFRNDLTGENRSYPGVAPVRAAALTQWDWWYSFVGNVLGTPGDKNMTGYETLGGYPNGFEWGVCYQNNENASDGGKCLSTVLRDGNFDYFTKEVHWHGIGGTGAGNGLTPPADSTLPASLYLASKPAFFGSLPWPWVNGASASNPVPGQLPAKMRYDAGTPNTLIGG